MRILIISPLYPPDIAPLSVYVKELGRRLKDEADVTILAYTHIPELIQGVKIITVPKYSILPIRLFSFFKALVREAKRADVLYIQNGISVELPTAIYTRFSNKKSVVYLSDTTALTTTSRRPLFKKILYSLLSHTHKVLVSDTAHGIEKFVSKTTLLKRPLERPEILPFAEYPKDAFAAYETSWDAHIHNLNTIFHETSD